MGNIRIHIGLNTPVEAPAEMWLTALLVSLPINMRERVLQNLDSIRKSHLKIIKPTPGANGKILMPG